MAPLLAVSAGMAREHRKKLPFRFTSIQRVQSSSVAVAIAAKVKTFLTSSSLAYSMSLRQNAPPRDGGWASPMKRMISCTPFGSFQRKSLLLGNWRGTINPSFTLIWSRSKISPAGNSTSRCIPSFAIR